VQVAEQIKQSLSQTRASLRAVGMWSDPQSSLSVVSESQAWVLVGAQPEPRRVVDDERAATLKASQARDLVSMHLTLAHARLSLGDSAHGQAHGCWVHSSELSALALAGLTPAACLMGAPFSRILPADARDAQTLVALLSAALRSFSCVLLERFGAWLSADSSDHLLALATDLGHAAKSALWAANSGRRAAATQAEIERFAGGLNQLLGTDRRADCARCNACAAGNTEVGHFGPDPRSQTDPLGDALVDAVERALE
jgi:hypothetical protein